MNAYVETAMGTSLQGLGTFQKKYREAVHEMGLLFLHRWHIIKYDNNSEW